MNDTIIDTPLMPAPTSPGDQPLPRRNPPCNCHPPAWYCISATTYSSEFSTFVSAINSLQKPKSYSEVIKSLEWQYAINKELAAFQLTHTLDHVLSHLVQIL